MPDSEQQSWFGGLLKPLKDFMADLYAVGGLPLVLIGIGAANLLLVPYGENGETKEMVITIVSFVFAVLIWSVSAYIEARRSIIKMGNEAKQDEIVLSTISELAKMNMEGGDQAAVQIGARIDKLLGVLSEQAQPVGDAFK